MKAYRPNKKNKGQVIVAGMALMLVAGVMLFFVFNSSRAVNEKINLVNAADAAAYSGAQVAARQLNFMAYTNRAMIANEVAIGHMVSFQAEVNLVANTLGSGLSGVATIPFLFIIDAGLSYLGTSRAQIMGVWSQEMNALTGTYILATDATNQMYSDFQQQEYLSLSGATDSAVIDAMQQVANEYVKHSDVTISVNDPDILNAVISGGNAGPKVVGKAYNALNNVELCMLVMFAAPGNTAAPANQASQQQDDDDLMNYCNDLTRDIASSPMQNPVNDAGALLNMLVQSTADSSAAEWIQDRNKSYELITRNVDRTGTTTVEWDSAANQINWIAANDKIRSDPGILGINDLWIKIDGKGSADANSTAAGAGGGAPLLSPAINGLLDSFKVCDSIDCSQLSNNTYQGGHNYAFINPMKSSATVYAFLDQKGNCNDLLGRDDNTKEVISGWKDDQTRYGSNCSQVNLQAISSAKIFYKRPSCQSGCAGFRELADSFTARPNLYNPFWQARLSVTSLAE